MKLKNLFDRDITRGIKGVIKIGQDDEANVFQELDEYVVTRELNKHFSTFFKAYQNSINEYTDKMGVWISGFFGSGKSHFLKILSYLLGNKQIEGKKSIDFFDGKIRDPLVLADMERAGNVSTDVIIFNIDSKSDIDSKTNKEAIARVFNKVFDEMQGYCSTLPWLAELERQMEKEGSYAAFKKRYLELSGKPWVDSREDYYFEEDNIIKALADTTRMSLDSARRWYERGEENYALSVEKFANKVKGYIESKEGEHHVIFLVDEMGQYIGDDSRLILNLQTVVEDLGTYCGGKAWVLVTSQQDIDTVTRVKGENFSKIQARFNTRLSLSSANVDEVIKKRLLAKKEVGRDTLKLLYADKEAILKNLLTFSAETPEMKIYRDSEDFIDVYPFIPYQFRLLQAVFTAIRLHGASGKHLAEGERSLLSAFQEAAIQFAERPIGALIPFSAFYETIETFLDHNVRMVIIHAEDNENLNEADIEVLKVLFLIKWVKEMPPTLENLATLMVSHIDEDIIDRKKKIEESLRKLLKETLIQKNGDEYFFLTHEEQDINREINNIPLDLGEITKNMGEEIFNGIYGENRFRYSDRYHFDFNKTIDDRNLNVARYEIGVKIISPYYATNQDKDNAELKMLSSRENSVIINLSSDTRALEEMEQIYKIQTYLTRRGGAATTPEIEDIKNRKAREMADRKERVRSLLIDALKGADFYVNARKIDLTSKQPVERINQGIRMLVDSIYNKLGYIKSFIESNNDLQNILSENKRQLNMATDDDIPNKLALDEVRAYIDRSTRRNIPLTMKSLLDLYSRAPYGWLDNDIRGLILRLFKNQEIRFQMAGEYISFADKDLVSYTIKREYTERLVIKRRDKLPEGLLQNAKELIKDLFNVTALPDDEDGLMQRFVELSKEELSDIKTLLVHYKSQSYPDKGILEKGQALFETALEIKDNLRFYETLQDRKKELFAYAEDIVDVRNFFQNQQGYFDRALVDLGIYEKNRSYVLDKETVQVVKEIEDIVYGGKPYPRIHELPGLMESFRSKFVKLLDKEIKPVREVVERDRQQVADELEKHNFKDELSSKFQRQFKDILNRLDACNNFYEAIAMKEESDRLKLRCFEEIDLAKEKQAKKETKPGVIKPPPKKKLITLSMTNILHGARTLETKEDVEELLGYLREQLLGELKDNARLRLI